MRLLPAKLRKQIVEPGSGDRSKALFSVIKQLGNRGLEAVTIKQIIRAHPNGIGAKYVGRPDLDKEIERVLAKPSSPAPNTPSRPIVRVIGGELPAIIDRAEEILIAADPDVYAFGDQIVRPAMQPIRIADEKETRGLRLVPIASAHMRERFTRHVTFLKFNKREDEWVSIDCPETVAKTYLERIGLWRVPQLSGVTTCPVPRPDAVSSTSRDLITQPGSCLIPKASPPGGAVGTDQGRRASRPRPTQAAVARIPVCR